jgi:3'(2'), 5'-bisphosphate nucleotidase
LVEKIVEIAKDSGEAVLEIYSRDFEVEFKDDKSPLTEADKVSNEIICENLEKLYPEIPILSEENKTVPFETRKEWVEYWCIDPIDGTKEFIKKNDEFTINIALIRNGIPVLGVVYAPAIGKIYYAEEGKGAFLNGEKLEPKRVEKLRVVASKSHRTPETENFISELGNCDLVSKGSSLKLCMVASGEADIYPRIAPTMEWDTAAAHAVVLEAGKETYIYSENISPKEYLAKRNLEPMRYNKENLLNPYFVVV